jgi:galactokinase
VNEDPRAARVRAAFADRFGRLPELLVRAPGRVVLLGAHVDHQQAEVLPAAIDKSVFLAAARRPDRRLRLAALDLGREAELELDYLPPPCGERQPREASFADYPAGVAAALEAAGFAIGGLDAAYGGDLPQGAGVSSSAAVEIAFLLAFAAAGGFALGPAEAARLARHAENSYLGVMSGLMDPLASLHGRAGHAILLDCRSLAAEPLPLPPGLRLLVFDSGVRRSLVLSGYNDRRGELRQATLLLRAELPGLEVLRDLAPDDFERLRHLLPPPLERRVRHCLEEMARVAAGAAALRQGDAATLGRLMNASQASSRELYQVSLPELDLLCAAAAGAPGCYGARLMGGGFGGVVAALVEAESSAQVAAEVARAFEQAFGRRPPFFETGMAGGAELLSRPAGQGEDAGETPALPGSSRRAGEVPALSG